MQRLYTYWYSNRIIKWICLIIGMLQLSFSLIAQMPTRNADSLQRYYTQKATRFLDYDHSLQDFYSIDLYGVSVFAGVREKKENRPEYRVTWLELSSIQALLADLPREDAMSLLLYKGSKSLSPQLQKQYSHYSKTSALQPSQRYPLQGLRIAIDPGHFAYDSITSRIEDKYLYFYSKQPNGDSLPVDFYESKLTWQTAQMLAFYLQSAGAEVLFTREYGKTVLGITYQQWKEKSYPRALDSLLNLYPNNLNLKMLKTRAGMDDRLIFRSVFRDVELRKRADKINAFQPDLTVILHYNVDEQNDPWKSTSTKNFNMAFVGGAFQIGELSDAEKRFDFLRLLLTTDLERSILLSGFVAKRFESELHVPLAGVNDAAYLKSSCMTTDQPGVFCRNLSMTRLVHGQLVYGETLYQDNAKECLALHEAAGKDVMSSTTYIRTMEVANAYFKGILDWAKTQH